MINLKEEVLTDLKSAMREKNAQKLEAVRAVKSAIDKFEKENPGQDINYPKALKPLVKQRIDSIEQYTNAGNSELADKEKAELDVINAYLEKVQPKQFSKEELEVTVKQYVTDNSLGKSDMGKIMSYFKSNFDGQYDGKELSLIVKSVL
jgi:uncharacterized protein